MKCLLTCREHKFVIEQNLYGNNMPVLITFPLSETGNVY
jgi:hypothetical protein